MSALRAARAEWCQFRRRGDGLAAAALLIPAAGLYGWLLGLLADGPGLGTDLLGATGVESTGFSLAFRVARDLLLVLGLLLVHWGAGALAGDRAHGTLRLLALRAPRAAVGGGKALFLATAGVGVALAILLASLLVGEHTFGLRDVRAGHAVIVAHGELLAAGLVATGLTCLPLLSALAVSLAVSSLARTPAGAQAAAGGLVLALAALSLVPGAGQASFLATASWPFAVAANLGAGLRTAAFGDLAVAHVAVNLAWIAGALLVVLLALQRRDIP